MTYVKLRQNAPEADSMVTCTVCGTTDAARVTGHVTVGTPGASADAGVCEGCGRALKMVSERFGQDLTVKVEQSQTAAGGHEITIPDTREGASAVNPARAEVRPTRKH